MSQEELQKALDILTTLETQLDREHQASIIEAKQALQAAQRNGEGQDAEELREKIQQDAIAQSEFTSVMVHEIRKPLTSIRGYTDMLGKNIMGELNDMQSQFVGTIRNNVLSMEQLVTDISDISKLRSGRLRTDPKMEMFKNITMQVEKDVKDLAESRGVTLTMNIPSGLPLLNIDSVRTGQALRKIIENALKYTPENEGQVTVTAEGQGDEIHVTISDNGVGISEADQPHITEIFFRGDQELVTQSKGYGLGLPIAIECLALVGGKLAWESVPDEGSTFTIILPAMPA